ncbi:MAG: permease [Patescibacteria group bacterium]
MTDESLKMKAITYGSWGFLLLCIIALAATYQASEEIGKESVGKFLQIFWEVFPILIIVFILLFFFNAFFDQEKLIKLLGNKSGLKGWGLAILGGVLSYGPAYMWYPMLQDLMKKGMRTSLAVTFLYNRGVQLALLPMMLYYFGAWFTVLLLISMIVFSVINGFIVEKLVKLKK